MTKIAWMSDLHLNHLPLKDLYSFLSKLKEINPDVVLISGDTAESDKTLLYLGMISQQVSCNVNFVLGNHDYYFSSVDAMRVKTMEACELNGKLVYLSGNHYINRRLFLEHDPVNNCIGVSDKVAITGHDGWADRFYGKSNSNVFLNDYRLIRDLSNMTHAKRIKVQRELAAKAAEFAETTLRSGFEKYDHIIFVTHIPPFVESCIYDGKVSDEDWLPHFTCKTLGDSLKSVMQERLNKKLIVLCGHTHGKGVVDISSNLRCYTGSFDQNQPASDYNFPSINVFTLEELLC